MPDGGTPAKVCLESKQNTYLFAHPCFSLKAWTVVPTILSDADAAHLVGMCAACKRAEGDPLRVLQLGVSISEILVGFYVGLFESHATGRASQWQHLRRVRNLYFGASR